MLTMNIGILKVAHKPNLYQKSLYKLQRLNFILQPFHFVDGFLQALVL